MDVAVDAVAQLGSGEAISNERRRRQIGRIVGSEATSGLITTTTSIITSASVLSVRSRSTGNTGRADASLDLVPSSSSSSVGISSFGVRAVCISISAAVARSARLAVISIVRRSVILVVLVVLIVPSPVSSSSISTSSVISAADFASSVVVLVATAGAKVFRSITSSSRRNVPAKLVDLASSR